MAPMYKDNQAEVVQTQSLIRWKSVEQLHPVHSVASCPDMSGDMVMADKEYDCFPTAIGTELQSDPPGELVPGEAAIVHMAPVLMDDLAAQDIIRMDGKSLMSCQSLGMGTATDLDVVSSLLTVEFLMDITQPVTDVAEGSRAVGSAPSTHADPVDRNGRDPSCDKFSLGTPSHNSAQVERKNDMRSLNEDLELTPASITRLSSKYHLDESAQVEEIVDDEDIFHDPTLNALKMLLEANATEAYLDSLPPEGRQTALDFRRTCVLAETEETNHEFKLSSLLALADQSSFSGVIFEAIRLLVVAATTPPFASLSPAGRKVVLSFLDALLKTENEFPNCNFSQLSVLLSPFMLWEGHIRLPLALLQN